MNRYKFSICIPTWNRAEFLDQTLNNISTQIEGRKEFQLVISDNNSTDGTYGIVSKYCSKLNIKYLKLDHNIGGSKNINQVVSCADGRYCIFLGDDDVFRDGWLTTLISLVDKYNPDVMVSDRIVCDIDLNPQFIERCGPLVSLPTIFNCSEEGVLLNYLNQTTSTSGFGFFSNLIVKKSLWDNAINSNYPSNHPFPHMIKIMDILYNIGGMLLRVPLATVYARSGNQRLSEYTSNIESSEFEQLLSVHFEGFLSAAKFIFPNSIELKSALLNPITRIFDENYKINFLKVAENLDMLPRAENFIYQLEINSCTK